jgi:hypothetical protein
VNYTTCWLKSWKNGRNTLFLHWKSGNFLHFKLGKVEKTINPKASWQHSLRPNLYGYVP